MIFQLPFLLGDFGSAVCLIPPSFGRSGDVINRSMVIGRLGNVRCDSLYADSLNPEFFTWSLSSRSRQMIMLSARSNHDRLNDLGESGV
ncbi:hypothetical protein OROGR_026332 [Orobanche gracilis]